MIYNNISEDKQIGFQEEGTLTMIGLRDLHDKVMYYMIIIITLVIYMTINIIKTYSKKQIINKYLTHSTLIEIIWTILPTIILIIIAIPTFKLLYSLEELINPFITLKVVGNQWFWNYSISDYDNIPINFDSYLINDITDGMFRLLEVDNKIYLPILTPIRILISSEDVIHSFAIPSLGIKLDAIPGRINQIPLFLLKEGIYYGQCSELCGLQHSFMPIVLKAVNNNQFFAWVFSFYNFSLFFLFSYIPPLLIEG